MNLKIIKYIYDILAAVFNYIFSPKKKYCMYTV